MIVSEDALCSRVYAASFVMHPAALLAQMIVSGC
jgi:hypothetical protein